MNDISILNSDKEKYNEMINVINRVIQNLNYSISELGDISRVVADNYKINDERADKQKIELYKNQLVNYVNWLKNIILPSINEHLSSCNSQISDLMSAMLASAAASAPIISSTNTSTQTYSKSNNTSAPKTTVTTSKISNNTKITSNTTINNTKKATVKKDTISSLKKMTTSVLNSIIGGLFR